MKLLSELERLVKELSDSAFGRNPERFICNDKTNTVQKSFKEPQMFFYITETVKQLYRSPSNSNACTASWQLHYTKIKTVRGKKKKRGRERWVSIYFPWSIHCHISHLDCQLQQDAAWSWGCGEPGQQLLSCWLWVANIKALSKPKVQSAAQPAQGSSEPPLKGKPKTHNPSLLRTEHLK